MTATATHDVKALEVARTMVSLIKPEDAFLFGSRARGDWEESSDIEVFTIARQTEETRANYQYAKEADRAKALDLYGYPVKVDVVRLSPEDFHHFRQAPSHIAHSALKEGIDMSSEGIVYQKITPETPAAQSFRYASGDPVKVCCVLLM